MIFSSILVRFDPRVGTAACATAVPGTGQRDGGSVTQETRRCAQIVDYWRAIEILSPPAAPKLTRKFPAKASVVVLDIPPGEPAPWHPEHRLATLPLDPDQTWQFTVYAGLYPLLKIQQQLIELFGSDGKYRDSKVVGESALLGLNVDATGYVVENSATLSACAWALGRLKSPEPDRPSVLDGFQHDERMFAAAFDKLVPMAPPPAPTRLSGAAKAVGAQAKSAATDAVSAGAKATGTAVTAATATAVTTLAGPILGSIAGAAAGKFAESLLTPHPKGQNRTDPPPGSGIATTPIPNATPIPIERLRNFATQLAIDLVSRKRCSLTWTAVVE